MQVCRYRLIEDEFSNPSVPELQKYLTDEDYRWQVYIVLLDIDLSTLFNPICSSFLMSCDPSRCCLIIFSAYALRTYEAASFWLLNELLFAKQI